MFRVRISLPLPDPGCDRCYFCRIILVQSIEINNFDFGRRCRVTIRSGRQALSPSFSKTSKEGRRPTAVAVPHRCRSKQQQENTLRSPLLACYLPTVSHPHSRPLLGLPRRRQCSFSFIHSVAGDIFWIYKIGDSKLRPKHHSSSESIFRVAVALAGYPPPTLLLIRSAGSADIPARAGTIQTQ